MEVSFPRAIGVNYGARKVNRNVVGLPCAGDPIKQTGFLFPGQSGFSIVVPVVGEDLKGVGPGEVQTGKNVVKQTEDLGKGQERFFFENFRRIVCRKAWAMKTWSMWRCHPCQERCS